MSEQKENMFITEPNFVVFLEKFQEAAADGWTLAVDKPLQFYNIYNVVLERTPKKPVGRPKGT